MVYKQLLSLQDRGNILIDARTLLLSRKQAIQGDIVPSSISYIVSAFNRPMMLKTCLASLTSQVSEHNREIIVTDNTLDIDISVAHSFICSYFGVRYIRTMAESCYHSAEMGAALATNEWLCFPSDDSYYVPLFESKMLNFAAMYNWDLVYCDLIYELHRIGQGQGYKVLDVQPKWCHIDKTCFVLRRHLFESFPDKGKDGLYRENSTSSGSDGYLIESLVARPGLRHGKVVEVLAVHN